MFVLMHTRPYVLGPVEMATFNQTQISVLIIFN